MVRDIKVASGFDHETCPARFFRNCNDRTMDAGVRAAAGHTIVAIATNVAQTALIFPISERISQLTSPWLKKQAWPVYDSQAYDDDIRAPLEAS